MAWFAAHIVEYLKCLDAPQDEYMAWENIVLLEAADGQEAWRLAEARVQRDAAAARTAFLPNGKPCWTYDGQPAMWVHAGVRGIVAFSHEGAEGVVGSGDEATYNTMFFRSEADVRAFVEGRGVTVRFEDEEKGGPE